jgi:hypothetical protein
MPAFPRAASHPLSGRTILQIIPELDAGGAERTAIDVAAGLAAVGARPIVASVGGRLVGELQAHGGIWVPFPAATKNPAAMLVNVRRLARIAHDEGAVVIHARSRAPAWVGLGAARALGIPFVTTYHGSYAGQSASEAPLQLGDGAGGPRHRQLELHGGPNPVLVPVGVRSPPGRPSRHRSHRVFAGRRRPAASRRPAPKLGIAPHERIVLLAARLTSWKGQKVLIEAAGRLRGRGLDDIAYVWRATRRAATAT